MKIRAFTQHDLAQLTELTIDTFRPFYEDSFRPLALGAEVVEIDTGGDRFHAPARALYEALGCTPLPRTVYFRQL
ncbi:hypothetical protein [Streptomyces kanamyceticus]|uniref:GNAT family acetyltransferase n=1 Tax=Streptomyces kanamyceticus TaxID=1967 RepID=A0A5J6GA85_STRKN|nr:hypothetical protein [Streptomyces kanamyceticus]QEU90176.1 GNAT family acetyltransferase [Streptomyces kanamyceticus]